MNESPHELADKVVRLAAEYAQMSEELANILKVKAVKWAMFRSDSECKSDKSADHKWDATPEGLREMQLKLIMKASEKSMSAYKSMLRVMETEARNAGF